MITQECRRSLGLDELQLRRVIEELFLAAVKMNFNERPASVPRRAKRASQFQPVQQPAQFQQSMLRDAARTGVDQADTGFGNLAALVADRVVYGQGWLS